MKPIYIHSGMTGAPQYANANGNIPGILEVCLVNGFNSKTATSASASGGVLTLNFASDPGFEALQTVEVAVSSVAAVNGVHRVIANSSNQVTIAIAGLADGTVGSSGAGITIKQAGAGWSKPFSSSTVSVFRPPAGSRRYLRCAHTAGANMSARGYGEMTDIDTGTDPFPTAAQVASPVAIYNNTNVLASGSYWMMCATDKWFIFSIGSTSAFAGGVFFGDPAGQTVPADAYASLIYLQNGWYGMRNHAGAAGAITISARVSDGSSATWPSVIADGAKFLPYVPVVEATGNVLRSVLPNIYKMYPSQPANQLTTLHSNVVGVTGRMKPFCFTNGQPLDIAIAIDEEVWG